nr:T9SS type A sorting domain-containing protein [uncultured Draconibacterium sp.]
MKQIVIFVLVVCFSAQNINALGENLILTGSPDNVGSWKQYSSDNFLIYAENQSLQLSDLAVKLEAELKKLDYSMNNKEINPITGKEYIPLLDFSGKLNVYIYKDNLPDAPSSYQDWDIGYYDISSNTLFIKEPSIEDQKYYPSVNEASIAILARYVLGKKLKFNGDNVPESWSQVGFGLYESGYKVDESLLKQYFDQYDDESFPLISEFNGWDKLSDATNIELSVALANILIIDYGYLDVYYASQNLNFIVHPSQQNSKYYHLARLLFLEDEGKGKITRSYSDSMMIVYSYDPDRTQIVVDAIKDDVEELKQDLHGNILHPVVVTLFRNDEDFTYATVGNINELKHGAHAISHYVIHACDEETTLRKLIRHEYAHSVVAYIATKEVPAWLNEGVATHYGGQTNLSSYNFDLFHQYFWINQQKLFPPLDDIFGENGDFGYRMARYSYEFLLANKSADQVRDFIRECDNYSIIDYSDGNKFNRHLYETAYHSFMPEFLFSPQWDTLQVFNVGKEYSFGWQSHYISTLKVDYSEDGANWQKLKEVGSSVNSFDWVIPDTEHLQLRFSDIDFPEIAYLVNFKTTTDTLTNIIDPSQNQELEIGEAGEELRVTEVTPADSRSWYYAIFSGGDYSHFLADGFSFTPLFDKSGSYFIVCKSSWGDKSYTSNEVKIVVSGNETLQTDSLALVALFQQNGGENWLLHQNWLVGSVDTWENVTVENDRVVELNLYDHSYTDKFGLTGDLTPEISKLTALRVLRLSNNDLTGELPEDIGNMSNLERLVLFGNKLSGPIPESIGNISTLNVISIADNNFSGSIPSSFGNLTKLVELNAGWNNFSGSLPASIGKLNYLNSIDIRGNQFTGDFPKLSATNNIRVLAISDNNFTGLPSLISSFSTNPLTFWVENNYLTFEDLESNMGVVFSNDFIYSPQKSMADSLLSLNAGENLIIDPGIGGSQNIYQWYKDGVEIDNTSDILELYNVPASAAGKYTCKVTNALVPRLVITSRNFAVTVTGSITGINEAVLKDMQVFPNPSDGKFRVQYAKGIQEICIFSATGEKVYQNTQVENAKDIFLQTKGFYFVRITTVDGEVASKSIIIR